MLTAGMQRDAVLALAALLSATIFFVALSTDASAGHEFAVNGNGGDCWRAGTPYDCRTTWATGDGHSIYLRIINQLSDSSLWNAALTACNNWATAPGPQYCSSNPVTNDSWDYFKRDDYIPDAPNGYTWNCSNAYGCPANSPLNIQWSEIYVTIVNDDYPQGSISVDGHEMGHSLGLDHHGAAGSNVALMTQGTTLQSPNSIDIGPLPACATNPVGSNGTGGVRCIYNATY